MKNCGMKMGDKGENGIRKVLVTGGAGYIGSVLTGQLLDAGYLVRVVDCLLWEDAPAARDYAHPHLEFVKADLREEVIQEKALEGVDAVVHLAAIVGDPACQKEPALAEEINWRTSKAMFDQAGKMGVQRFIFASTCSNYGRMSEAYEYIDETGILNPISWYAKLKVRFEEYLLHTAVGAMAAVSLRFATAYGLSRRMRFDLTVNEFVKDAWVKGRLTVFGETFWRPYCHVEDLARACICVLKADRQLVDREVFNVGETKENYQKRTIVDLIRNYLPQLEVSFVQRTEDPRDYKVDFGKIKNRLNFSAPRTVEDGIKEVIQVLQSGGIQCPDDRRYRNS